MALTLNFLVPIFSASCAPTEIQSGISLSAILQVERGKQITQLCHCKFRFSSQQSCQNSPHHDRCFSCQPPIPHSRPWSSQSKSLLPTSQRKTDFQAKISSTSLPCISKFSIMASILTQSLLLNARQLYREDPASQRIIFTLNYASPSFLH